MLISFTLLTVQILSSHGSAVSSPQVGACSREDTGDAIGRRPMPEFIIILGRINATAPLAGR